MLLEIDEITNWGEKNRSMDSNDFQQMNDSEFIFLNAWIKMLFQLNQSKVKFIKIIIKI
jgi:hypothetical protein